MLVPAVLLQLYYWVTVFGCSSSVWRGSLGSVCDSSYLYASLMEQQAPWYTDLWSDQEAIEPNVRPPQRVKSLLVGYLHVCDSKLYLQDYLNKIESISTKMKTNDLHRDLSKWTLRIPFGDIWRLDRSITMIRLTFIQIRQGLLGGLWLMSLAARVLWYFLHWKRYTELRFPLFGWGLWEDHD